MNDVTETASAQDEDPNRADGPLEPADPGALETVGPDERTAPTSPAAPATVAPPSPEAGKINENPRASEK